MPRRAFLNRHVRLKPPDEQTEQKYLRHWPTKELYHTPEIFPLATSEALFDNAQPLEIEIGCGSGEFLSSLAAGRPETNFVGFDISFKSLYLGVERARSMGLDNILFVRAPIQFAYPLLATDSLQAVYLHFPDPILHPKYRKRRIANEGFISNIHRALKPGGKLSVVTDSQEFFSQLTELIVASGGFRRTHGEPHLIGFEAEAKSRYQLYWESHGVPIYRLEVVKRET